MGKHHRAHAEQQRQKEQRNRKIAIGTVGGVTLAGAALVAQTLLDRGGERYSHVPELVRDGYARFYETFRIPEDKQITITLADGREVHAKNPHIQKEGDEGLGFTLGKRITIAKDLFRQDAENVAIHELVHASPDAEPRQFPQPLELESGFSATGSHGFRIWFSDSTPDKPNTFNPIDEGAAEWISQKVPGYKTAQGHGYPAVRELTGMLAEKAGLDRDGLFAVQRDSDLLGFVAGVYKTQRDEVTPEQLGGVIMAYNDAYTSGIIPTTEQLALQYAIE